MSGWMSAYAGIVWVLGFKLHGKSVSLQIGHQCVDLWIGHGFAAARLHVEELEERAVESIGMRSWPPSATCCAGFRVNGSPGALA